MLFNFITIELKIFNSIGRVGGVVVSVLAT
jgi:hypothetical protein